MYLTPSADTPSEHLLSLTIIPYFKFQISNFKSHRGVRYINTTTATTTTNTKNVKVFQP